MKPSEAEINAGARAMRDEYRIRHASYERVAEVVLTAAASVRKPAPVVVKQLEWEDVHEKRGDEDSTLEVTGFEAETAFRSFYNIIIGPVWYDLIYDYIGLGRFKSEDEAKAVAQADYEQRISSALEPRPLTTTSVVSHETGNVEINESSPVLVRNIPTVNDRDIYEVANQLEGYVDESTPERLAAFLIREGKAACDLADEIMRLRSILNSTPSADREALVTDAMVDAAQKEILRYTGHPSSLRSDMMRQALKAAISAPAPASDADKDKRIAELEAALKPFANEAVEFDDEYRKDWEFADDKELIGSQFVNLTFGDFRAANRALNGGGNG